VAAMIGSLIIYDRQNCWNHTPVVVTTGVIGILKYEKCNPSSKVAKK
jgi:hypothetical protein